MSNTNLSIIIPCYNAEKYIQKCITSITEQTYTKLEIIIIDDGSTDQSGNICDRLASSDARIKVIHQPNQGSSLTRKRGIELATGDCVTFVDADDWIHPKMYEIMMEGMIKENADIAQCGWCDAYLNKRTGEIALKHLKTDQINNEYIKYDRIKGVLKILEDTQWRSFMWNKIFRKVLFQGIEFPIGRFLDDDTTIMHQLFHKANLTIYFPSEFYYYLRGSLTQVKDDVKRSKDIIDRTDARWERLLFTRQHPEYYPMLLKIHNLFISEALAGYRWGIKHPQYFSKEFLHELRKRILEVPLPYKEQMPSIISKAKTIEYFLFRYMYPVYWIMNKIITK